MCQACEVIFGVRYYTDEDYAAEIVEETYGTQTCVPNSIEISVDGNDSSRKGQRKTLLMLKVV